jgi:hypothetical protein
MSPDAKAIIDLIEVHRWYYERLKKNGDEYISLDEIIKNFETLERVAKK